MRFSTTERASYRRCRRRWSWEGKSQANLEPLGRAVPLTFGSALHEALAQYHLAGDDPVLAFQASSYYALLADEDQQLGVGMLTYYKEWNSTQEPLTFLVAEYPFEVAVPGTDHIYSGIVDGVAEDTSGGIWVVEHKGYGSLASMRRLAIDDQTTSYIWAMQETLGVPINGVLYNQLRKKLPSPPRLLVSGKLSTNITLDMTYESYLQAIRARDLDPDDYKDTLLELYRKPPIFFRRDKLSRNAASVASIREHVRMEVSEMSNPDLPIYPNITYDCDRCPFYDPCRALEEGVDAGYLLKSLYTKKEATP